MSYAPCAPVAARGAGNPLYDLSTSLTARVNEHRNRRSLKRLLEHEEYVLDDMGFARVDIDWVLSLPLTIDAAAELARLTEERRKARM
ncbi:MAG: hypothetical protein HKN27_17255 [Silicimonas sp.]|nr:hypothetical protein [Silicimonas sp.]